MSVKTNGKEWKEYYVRDWPKGWWHEDSVITVDGKSDEDDYDLEVGAGVHDKASVVLSGGCIMDANDKVVAKNMEAHFKAWRKAQSHTSFLVECHKDEESLLRDVIKAHGGKVL